MHPVHYSPFGRKDENRLLFGDKLLSGMFYFQSS